MTCDEAKGLFADEWAGILPPAESNGLHLHFDDCAVCRQEAEGLKSLWSKLDLLYSGEPLPEVRSRFYSALGAYGDGLSSARERSRFWPSHPAWPLAAAAALLIGLGLGYATNSRSDGRESSEVAQLRGEVKNMRQLVALSLLREQSASERLSGIGWANQVDSSNGQVLSALLDSVNHDPNVNVRLAAADALRTFAMNAAARKEIAKSITRQAAPLVQIALIDLVVDLKDQGAVGELRHVAADGSLNPSVRERATWAVERLQ